MADYAGVDLMAKLIGAADGSGKRSGYSASNVRMGLNRVCDWRDFPAARKFEL